MSYEIFLSIKPQFVKLIAKKEKTHEFRSYKPKKTIRRLWIYIPSPVSELKYIAEVKEPLEYPEKIPEEGYGNKDFNKGLNKSKYAFPISHLDEIVEGIPLKKLREKFNFTPPQSYVYIDRYPELVKFIENCDMRRLY